MDANEANDHAKTWLSTGEAAKLLGGWLDREISLPTMRRLVDAELVASKRQAPLTGSASGRDALGRPQPGRRLVSRAGLRAYAERVLGKSD